MEGSASGRGEKGEGDTTKIVENFYYDYQKQRRSLHVIVGPLVGHINNIFGLNLSGGSVSISMSFLRICCSRQRKSKQKTQATNATPDGDGDGDGCAKVAASLEIIIACVHIVLT